MRQSLAIAFVCVLVGGCSLIFNPSNLGKPADAHVDDAAIDVPPDVEVIKPADPTMLKLTEIFPATIDEGRGDSGSRPALLVMRGSNFDASDNIAIALSPDDGGDALMVTPTVAADHNFIALAVIAAVDASCHEGTKHAYTVHVNEDGATEQTLPGALTLLCHEELTQTTLDTAMLQPMYSQVNVSGSLTITGAAAAIIKSASTISITGAVTANASGQNPGPGGHAGGAIGVNGDGAGGGKTALLSGGGAGFAANGTAGGSGGAGGTMIGDLSITTYDTNYASGGAGDGTLGSLGSVGGGGGGTIELTANGDITLASIAAKGGGGAGSAGAGAGGLIVIRPLGGMTHGTVTLDVSAGSGGTAASVGRTRVDGATDSKIAAAYHGPGLGTASLISAGVQTPVVPAFGTPGNTIQGVVITRANLLTPFSYVGGLDGTGIGYGPAQATIPLTAGYNRVCLLTDGGDPTVDIAKDCIEMAFLP